MRRLLSSAGTALHQGCKLRGFNSSRLQIRDHPAPASREGIFRSEAEQRATKVPFQLRPWRLVPVTEGEVMKRAEGLGKPPGWPPCSPGDRGRRISGKLLVREEIFGLRGA